MSWIDQVQTDYVISTGDDKVYTPNWLNAKKRYAFNIAQFNFKGINGSLVKRGTPQGVEYALEIYFQGADNLDISRTFQTSSEDPRPWTITHPMYGSIYVQPTSLEFDDTQYNVTKITGTVIETLTDRGVAVVYNAPDAIPAATEQVSTDLATTFAADVPEIDTNALQQLTANIQDIYTTVSGKLNSIQANANSYTALYYDAVGVLDTTINSSFKIIRTAQNMLAAPANFIDTVRNRLDLLGTQLEMLGAGILDTLSMVNVPTMQLKKLYENNAGTVISGMCAAAVTQLGNDYDYRPDVIRVIQTILDSYNQYVYNLNGLQSANGAELDGYTPDPKSITELRSVVNNATATLFAIAARSRQQRIKTLADDTNLILVAAELYGMQMDDSTLFNLVANNDIGRNEVLKLEKGRKIVYYI